VSGSRSTRGTGGGGPIQGASAWPSSFTGPARYSPPFNAADSTDDPTPAYAEGDPGHSSEPYAPYAEAAADYADPYAADHYAPDPYAQDSYGYGAPAYVAPDYPVHDYGAYAGEDAYGSTRAEYAYEEAAYGETEWNHTQLLTETRLPEAPVEPGPGSYDDPYGDPGIPGPRGPGFEESPEPEPERESTRARGLRRPASRKVTWAGRAVQGVVLASLLGGVTAYVAFEKTVNVSVDGSVRQIHSFAATVGAALSSDDISTDSHDMVSPAPAATLADNSTITVKYGRPVDLTVNGASQHVWVHSTTVGAALQELGIRTQGARFVAVSAATPISRSGGDFSVYTMRRVTFLVDGKTEPVDTTAATVDQAMRQAGITLHNQDTASVSATAVPTDGETISILRITGTTEVKQVPIPYSVTKQNDPTAYVGSTSVVTAGVNGVATVTYALQTINGVAQKPKEISRVVSKQPVTEVEKVGTKSLPTNVASLNWAALAKCESGGNPRSVDSSGTYYGLYQFSISTWDSLGGSGLPSNASASEQTTRAELLYQRSGAGQWPVCGHNLFS